ncbi:hypothetical protein ANO11243_029260 [Dothideomycetidae sp. 11243]|nr:hypothetical protein ANO11243_029260 [fungal sp. No.11243]
MSIRGQKVLIDLGDGDDGSTTSPAVTSAPAISFVGDIQERKITHAAPPAPPAQRTSGSGFPAHRKRLNQSRFKSFRAAGDELTPEPEQPSATDAATNLNPTEAKTPSAQDERKQIDLDNRRMLESMTDAEIQHERQELLENINPALLQALLRRSKLEAGDDDQDFPGVQTNQPQVAAKTSKPRKKVTFEDATNDFTAQVNGNRSSMEPDSSISSNHDNKDQTHDDNGSDDRNRASSDGAFTELPTGSIHFPRPEQPPDLDPNSPSFLEDLHRKYFPSLPAEPEKLEWMKPVTGTSSYSPSQSALDPKDIRFSFAGALIPPSAAAEIPISAGLHHHGDAPDAAGYTIPELARLARSKVAAQRCIAFQTLGRVLFRLGKGEFGDPSEGDSGTAEAQNSIGELARGLWAEIEKEQVIAVCMNESEGKSMTGQRHVSAQAYATEAVWLWQMGGGRRWRTD